MKTVLLQEPCFEFPATQSNRITGRLSLKTLVNPAAGLTARTPRSLLDPFPLVLLLIRFPGAPLRQDIAAYLQRLPQALLQASRVSPWRKKEIRSNGWFPEHCGRSAEVFVPRTRTSNETCSLLRSVPETMYGASPAGSAYLECPL